MYGSIYTYIAEDIKKRHIKLIYFIGIVYKYNIRVVLKDLNIALINYKDTVQNALVLTTTSKIDIYLRLVLLRVSNLLLKDLYTYYIGLLQPLYFIDIV